MMNTRRFTIFGLLGALIFLSFVQEESHGERPDSARQCEFGAYVVVGQIEVVLPQFIVIDTAAAQDSMGNLYQVIAVMSDTTYYDAAAICNIESVRMNLIFIPRVEDHLVLPRNVVTIEYLDPSREEYRSPLMVTVREFLQPDSYFEFFQKNFRDYLRMVERGGQ